MSSFLNRVSGRKKLFANKVRIIFAWTLFAKIYEQNENGGLFIIIVKKSAPIVKLTAILGNYDRPTDQQAHREV